jgi:MFS family permease
MPFYGWTIVMALGYISAILIMLAGINLSLFVKPMGEAIGISAALFGWAGTLRALCGAVSGPLIGRLMDLHGPRFLLPVAVLFGATSVILLGHVTTEWQFLACFAVLGLAGMLGPAQLYTVVPITKWFVRRRGRAISMVFLGTVIGPVFLLPLNQIIIERFGYATAWLVIGLFAAATIIPLSLVYLRRQPEDLGLLPDGDPLPAVPAGAVPISGPAERQIEVREEERSWTRAEAMRTPAFWKLGLAFSFMMFAGTGFILFRFAHFIEQGMDPVVVSLGGSVDALLFGVSSVATGALEHRVSPRRLGSIGLAGIGGSLLLAITADSVLQMLIANALWGAAAGANNIAQQLIWASYYGRGHQGSIRGLITPLTLLIGNISGPLAGALHDVTGTYTIGWSVAVVLVFLGALLIATTPAPRWREAATAAGG